MSTLDILEDKWFNNTIRGIRMKWAPRVKDPASFDAFCAELAAVLGLDPATVRASAPAQAWRDFQQKADQYIELIIRKVTSAHGRKKWSTNFKKAFSTPAGGYAAGGAGGV